MSVDIVNFLRVETGDIESILQSVSQCDSISRKPGHVVGIAETGKTHNIAQDFSAALASVLFRFQHQDSATLRQQEPVPVTIKRTRGPRGLVVSSCEATDIVKR